MGLTIYSNVVVMWPPPQSRHRTFLSLLKVVSCSFVVSPPHPTPHLGSPHGPVFYHCGFVSSRTSEVESYSLSSFAPHIAFDVYPCCYTYQWFILLIDWCIISLWKHSHSLVSCLLVDGCSSSFQFGQFWTWGYKHLHAGFPTDTCLCCSELDI